MDELVSSEDIAKIDSIALTLELPIYLQENLKLAVSALKFLKLEYKEENFKSSRLFGRLTQLTKNIIVDVGHNTLAAHSILNSLKGKKVYIDL